MRIIIGNYPHTPKRGGSDEDYLRSECSGRSACITRSVICPRRKTRRTNSGVAQFSDALQRDDVRKIVRVNAPNAAQCGAAACRPYTYLVSPLYDLLTTFTTFGPRWRRGIPKMPLDPHSADKSSRQVAPAERGANG
jgi:hypothetical protein